jgi:NTE family protein
VAITDLKIYAIDAETFYDFFASEPSFRMGIADLLAERLRRRTSAKENSPTVAAIALPPGCPYAFALVCALIRGLDYYARVACVDGIELTTKKDIHTVGNEIQSWRSWAKEDEICVATVPTTAAEALRPYLRPGDVLLVVEDENLSPAVHVRRDWDSIATTVLRLCTSGRTTWESDDAWAFRLDFHEIASAESGREWDRARVPVLDSIARWITRRTIGVALGAGAARGFAHIGVLKLLDEAQIPIDCLSGSSIGGLVALAYALTGSADRALDLLRVNVGANKLIRDFSIIPRVSVLRGAKVRRISEQICANRSFADLTRPIFIVATDLLRGQRLVFDHGLLAPAGLATTAIPAVFPPIEIGNAWAVDGALISRVPVDVLERHRCGLKIAVSLRAGSAAKNLALEQELMRAMKAPFGLVHVIAQLLDVIGSRQNATDVAEADIVIAPETGPRAGMNFDAFNAMVEAGQTEAKRVLPDVLEAVNAILQPRRL